MMMGEGEAAKPKILVVDDSKLIRASFAKYLGSEFDVQLCDNGAQALAALEHADDFSLIFTDLAMPGMDGYELLERIRNSDNAALRDMPVIIVTGKDDDEQDKERILGLGATDFITKPFHSSELLSRARGYASLRKKVVRLEQKAAVDTLTGLATRDFFMQQGDRHVALARRQGFKLALARIAVANLEELKQEFGVPLVVKMVALVAKVLRENIRTEDIAGYLGTGQFALLLVGVQPQETAQVWARLRGRIAHFELKVGDKKARLVLKAGIAVQSIDDSVTGVDTLVQQAEDGLRTQLDDYKQTTPSR
jgi:diguanylate cyclase (GGDEF)-like protein